MEEWRDVVGYEGIYEVSNIGRVKRVKLQSGKTVERIMKQSIAKNGYRVVGLCVNSKPKVIGVHRLVAFAFHGQPPSNRHVVAHNDGDKTNNIKENLRWATPSENLFDAVVHGTNYGNYYGRKSAFSDEDILLMRASDLSANDLAEKYGVCLGTIYQILNNHTYKHLVDESYADKKLYGVSRKGFRARRKENSFLDKGDYIEIELTQGFVAKISHSDAKEILQRRWFAVKTKNGVYAFSSKTLDDGRRINIPLHRFIMNPKGDMVVDHINGDGLDNRRENLRIASHSQNQWNRRNARNNKTGYKGVSIDKRSGKFRAGISVGGKHIHLGLFSTAEEAAQAYAEASRKYHGEYGRTHLDD